MLGMKTVGPVCVRCWEAQGEVVRSDSLSNQRLEQKCCHGPPLHWCLMMMMFLCVRLLMQSNLPLLFGLHPVLTDAPAVSASHCYPHAHGRNTRTERVHLHWTRSHHKCVTVIFLLLGLFSPLFFRLFCHQLLLSFSISYYNSMSHCQVLFQGFSVHRWWPWHTSLRLIQTASAYTQTGLRLQTHIARS